MPIKFVEYVSNPLAQFAEAKVVSSRRLATSGCDLSDGLADALDHFCGDSVGICIIGKDIPLHEFAVDASLFLNIEEYRFAFGVGDWAAAYVIPQRQLEILFRNCPPTVKLTCIGTFTSSRDRVIMNADGNLGPVPHIVNEQFRDSLEDEGNYVLRSY